MALPKLALLSPLLLLACCPAAQAIGGVEVHGDPTCVYPILESDDGLYILERHDSGDVETFVGVARNGPTWTGAGIMYEGQCVSFFIPAKLTVDGADEAFCLVDLWGTAC